MPNVCPTVVPSFRPAGLASSLALSHALRLAPWSMWLALATACGGSSPPPTDPHTPAELAQSEPQEATTHGTGSKAKPASKYPEPFMEANCTDAAPEGYFPGGKGIVAEVRRQHWDELVACGHAVEGQVSGEIRTTFRLDPDGVPRCVEAPGINQTEVVRCVLAVYRTFRFPPPKNGSVRITDGIRLDSTEEDEE